MDLLFINNIFEYKFHTEYKGVIKLRSLRKEHLEILKALEELNANDFLSAAKIKEVYEQINHNNINVSVQYIKKYIKIFEDMGIVKQGLLAKKNAKTYYVDKETMQSFIEQLHQRYK